MLDFYSRVCSQYIVKTKLVFGLSLLIIILFLLPVEASAHHRQRVLGVSTSSNLSIAPTIEGPGFILPDSPLFFLDQIKQNLRVLLAFSSYDKAKVYKDIAGERLAELRFMLLKNNQDGIDTALWGSATGLKNAGRELSNARMFGKNVSDLAQAINDDIKIKQQTLDKLEEDAHGEMKAKVKAAQETIFEAKVEVEDALSQDFIESEIQYDLARKVKRYVDEADYSAASLEYDLAELERQASDAAKNSLKNREEVLEKVIAGLKKEQKVAGAEIKNQPPTLKKEAIEQARKAVEQAKEAAEKFKKASEEVKG